MRSVCLLSMSLGLSLWAAEAQAQDPVDPPSYTHACVQVDGEVLLLQGPGVNVRWGTYTLVYAFEPPAFESDQPYDDWDHVWGWDDGTPAALTGLTVEYDGNVVEYISHCTDPLVTLEESAYATQRDRIGDEGWWITAYSESAAAGCGLAFEGGTLIEGDDGLLRDGFGLEQFLDLRKATTAESSATIYSDAFPYDQVTFSGRPTAVGPCVYVDLCYGDDDSDSDGDRTCDDEDVCPGHNDNLDADHDDLPDGCDPCPDDAENDADGDKHCESVDNCPDVPNEGQEDADDDGIGDACEADGDGDGVIDDDDNCPDDANPGQDDDDGDGVGDVCELDRDQDGTIDDDDNCPLHPNAGQADTDGDGRGDACDLADPGPFADACLRVDGETRKADINLTGFSTYQRDGLYTVTYEFGVPAEALEYYLDASYDDPGWLYQYGWEYAPSEGHRGVRTTLYLQTGRGWEVVPTDFTAYGVSWLEDADLYVLDGLNSDWYRLEVWEGFNDGLDEPVLYSNFTGHTFIEGDVGLVESGDVAQELDLSLATLAETVLSGVTNFGEEGDEGYVDFTGTPTAVMPCWPTPISQCGEDSVSAQLATVPSGPVRIGEPAILTIALSDPNTGDVHEVTVDWGDDTVSLLDAEQDLLVEPHPYDLPGVYEVWVTVADADCTSAQSILVVVYDPDGGFVTGGGWIDSPEGAYADDPALTGKATFGFVSKYKNGATTPTGVTQFRFRAGDLDFHSDSYDWLVIAGASARYKGWGTIDGEGPYQFMVTGIDADLNGNDAFTIDRFRMKIWTEVDGIEEVVYDNAIADDADAASTPLGGGSIVIHKAE